MSYDQKDDGVFRIAGALGTLTTAMSERQLPRRMVLDDMRRIAAVAQDVGMRDESMRPAAQALYDIRAAFEDGRQDFEGSTLDLKDVLRGVRENYSSRIVYEGFVGNEIDAIGVDETIRRDFHLPGEKVRPVGGKAEGRVLHGEDDAVRVVSGVFATAESTDMGGPSPVRTFSVEYEFEGREGRHPARAFHSENGQEQVYGVILERGGRVFLTPIEENGGLDDPSQVSAGRTREVVGDAGRSAFHYVHPDGFKGLVEDLKVEVGESLPEFSDRGPRAGEFNYDPAAFGDVEGPIRLGGIPFQTSPSPSELDVANRQVDEFLLRETRSRAGSEIGSNGGLMAQAESLTAGAVPSSAKGIEERLDVLGIAAALDRSARDR